MKKWYLLKTKPFQEKKAVRNLENQNYNVYCPLAKIGEKDEILFPGYIFIQLDEKIQNWSYIRSTKGVSNFVRFGLSYAKVPDNILNLIKNNEQSTIEKLKNLNGFQPGDKVQIADGAFKNFMAIFKSYKSDERVILLMKLMGQQQRLNINRDSLIRL